MTKYVYMFSEGNAGMRNLLGGKGANLAEMTGLGLPVPRGFTITTEACTRYYEDGEKIAPDIEDEIFATLAKAEALIGKKFGDPDRSLPGLRPFRFPGLDAGHDGHHPEPRPQRRCGRRPGCPDRQPPFCL